MTWPKGIALARLALYAVLGLLAYHFLRTIGKGDTALDTWLASGKAQHATVASLLARDAQHRQQALQAAHQATLLQSQVTEATERFQALASAFRRHLDSAHTQPDTAAFQTVVRACYDAVHLCAQRAESLQHADSIDAGRADSLLAALRRSDSTLVIGLHVAPCKWLGFIACPSRTTALEVGVLSGLLAGYVVFHR